MNKTMAIATAQLLKSLLSKSNTINAPITTIQQAGSCLRAMIVMIARFHSQKLLVHARLAHDMSVVVCLMMVRADRLDKLTAPAWQSYPKAIRRSLQPESNFAACPICHGASIATASTQSFHI